MKVKIMMILVGILFLNNNIKSQCAPRMITEGGFHIYNFDYSMPSGKELSENYFISWEKENNKLNVKFILRNHKDLAFYVQVVDLKNKVEESSRTEIYQVYSKNKLGKKSCWMKDTSYIEVPLTKTSASVVITLITPDVIGDLWFPWESYIIQVQKNKLKIKVPKEPFRID